jgi:hypothetical protein
VPKIKNAFVLHNRCRFQVNFDAVSQTAQKFSAFVFGSQFHSTIYPQFYALPEDFLRANAFVFHERMEYSIELFINFIEKSMSPIINERAPYS